MRIPLTAQQVDDVLDRVLGIVPRLRTLHAELRILELEERADGYPRDTGWDKSSPGTEYDDDGTPMPPRTDPTAQAVIQRAAPGLARSSLQQMVMAIHNASRNLEHAECEAMRARPKDEKPADVEMCRHHELLRIRGYEMGARPRRGLCTWCEEFERANGFLPTKALLDRRQLGKAIYDRDVRQAAQAVGR